MAGPQPEEISTEHVIDVKQFTIFRVPAHIRERNRNYYEPRVVSIGPYNHGKEHLRAMEDVKKRYLANFLTTSGCTEEQCLKKMEDLEADARSCYFESPGLIEDGKFAEMVLLDGCFILELMREHYYNKRKNILSKNHFIRNDLLMLENQIPFFVLEELFKLLPKANSTAIHPPNSGGKSTGQVSSPPPNLVDLAFKYLKPAVKETKEESRLPENVRHLLHLHYCFLSSIVSSGGPVVLPRSEGGVVERCLDCCGHILDYCEPGNSHDERGFCGRLQWSLFLVLQLISMIIVYLIVCLTRIPIFILFGLFYCGWFELPERKHKYTIPSATELQEAGIKLRRRKSPESFWDVHFDSRWGTLSIPPVVVDESIKPLLMNLVAFEQYAEEEVFSGLNTDQKAPRGERSRWDFPRPISEIGNFLKEQLCGKAPEEQNSHSSTAGGDQKPPEKKSWKKFTAYALFMDCIVNTDKDAMALRQQGIIENMLGSEEAIAEFFNHLCEGVNHEENHYFSGMFDDVISYSESVWRRHKAKLMHDYFSSPWSIISLVAAFLALALTIVQTVLAILPLLKAPHDQSSK